MQLEGAVIVDSLVAWCQFSKILAALRVPARGTLSATEDASNSAFLTKNTPIMSSKNPNLTRWRSVECFKHIETVK